jgi:hypothetical protein
MQYIEHNHIISILTKHNILDYHRYVDDILIIYNEDHTDIEDTLKEFNSIHPNIQYTIEKVRDNQLNYLDMTIDDTHNTPTFSIYRKPTTTDIIIHNDSCHPPEHKNSAITYLINHMDTYPISKENQNHELQTIKTILQNNIYPPHTCIKTKPE